jgi:hypothetical protein
LLPHGLQLHTNGPGEPPPRLDLILRLTGPHAWFHALIGSPPEARLMRLEIWLHREGQRFGGRSVQLPPGGPRPVEVDFFTSGPGPATLSLELHLS